MLFSVSHGQINIDGWSRHHLQLFQAKNIIYSIFIILDALRILTCLGHWKSITVVAKLFTFGFMTLPGLNNVTIFYREHVFFYFLSDNYWTKKKGWLDIVWHAKKGKWPIMYFWFQITSAFTNSHELLVYMSSTKKGDGDIINTLKHLKTRGWIIDIQAFTWITINSWYPSEWKNITKMMGWTWDGEQANFKIFLDRWVCIKCIKLLYGF